MFILIDFALFAAYTGASQRPFGPSLTSRLIRDRVRRRRGSSFVTQAFHVPAMRPAVGLSL